MHRNLCIDIGNSRIKFAIFENDSLEIFEIFKHNQESEIFEFLQKVKFKKSIYTSVLQKNPDWINKLLASNNLLQLNINLNLPIKINYKSPSTLGTDRIAAMAGALGIFHETDILIINAGTCITYDLIDKNSNFIAGNIAPGLDMRWRAMNEFTSSLPRISEFEVPSQLLGNDTNSAVHNGGFYGLVFEMEAYFRTLRAEFPDLKAVLTGGTAPYLVNHLNFGIFAEPYLVLKGLNTILNHQ